MHKSVLLHEAVEMLLTRTDGRYVDATFGRGGHSAEILRRLSQSGRLLAIDRDPDAVAVARREFADDARFEIAQAAFSRSRELLEERGWWGRCDGILVDLGVSSPQLDDPQRGFSFQQDGPLDMRMDPASGVSAADWLAQAGEEEITGVLREYGEERFARRMARAIVAARSQAPITRTAQLAAIVAEAHPAWERGRHPATRAFQAIRIHVNRELDELDALLGLAVEALAAGGRLVVISFHSLEDRRVKRFMRDRSRPPRLPRGLPVAAAEHAVALRRIGGARRAGDAEISLNPRARSAVLRAAEKLQ
jgi:16S rRNA (cytosine1402-N4)-methyltransferase